MAGIELISLSAWVSSVYKKMVVLINVAITILLFYLFASICCWPLCGMPHANGMF